MESNSLDRVSDMLEGTEWHLCPTNHVLAIELRHQCSSIIPLRRDRILWNNFIGPVSLSHMWDTLRTRAVAPSWIKLVWHKYAVPKFSINLWLIMRQRLLTRDRMVRFGFNVNPDCFLCNDRETHEHLFINCAYVQQILKECPIPISLSWQAFQNGNITQGNVDAIRKNFASLYVATTFHFVWAERNKRNHASGPPRMANQLINDIKARIREKLYSNISFQQEIKKNRTLQILLF
ncbi:uncharacterized protein LOC141700491 [Apium graveolens]|uniref:uncharacterized protein LOC141700491 n=1 Tax=Apium graveolens TaxID=4045 RepID=UPI003D79AB15